MKLHYKLIFFMSWFATGLMLPITSLMLCAHGCTLQSLGLAISVYSAVTIIAEIPSGMFADLYGRKRSFLLSSILYATCGVLFMVSDRLYLIMIAMILQGLGRAFSSGSLDSLIVEETIEINGRDNIVKAVSAISVWQCVGLLLGALFGGSIPEISGYLPQLIIRTAFYIIAGVLTVFTVNESVTASEKRKLRTHVYDIKALLQGNKSLQYIAVCIIIVMLAQSMVEYYWQPWLIGIADNGIKKWLGVLCSAAYLATMSGSFIMGKWTKSCSGKKCWTIYISLALVIFILLFILALVRSAVWFAAAFTAFYLLIGLIGVPEQTIINMEAGNSTRCSILSIMSFAAQVGGMVSTLLCSAILVRGNIALTWIIGSIVSASGLVLLTLIRLMRKPKDKKQNITA